MLGRHRRRGSERHIPFSQRLRIAAATVVIAAAVGSCGNEADQPDVGGTDPEIHTSVTDDAEPGSGTTVKTVIEVSGHERADEEVQAIQTVLGEWGDERGITVTYVGEADWEAGIERRAEGGNPPDISIFPRADMLARFVRDGALVALNDQARAATSANWSDAWSALGNVDGTQYGVPVKAGLESLVWYLPQAFADAGYDVPTTFEEFTVLVDTITAAGGPKALCVGIESGQSTGWIYADWVADMVLRQHGPETYDQWVAHEIPFNDDRIVESMQTVLDLWSDDNVFASEGTIASTPFQDNGQPLVDGSCLMHRQASTYSVFIPPGTPFADGSPQAVDVFYFPDVNGDLPLLGNATLAAAFNDDPNVHSLLAYMATAEYAEKRQAFQRGLIQQEIGDGEEAFSGFLSAAVGQDRSTYNPLERRFVDILENAGVVRPGANQTLPAEVAADAFWTEGTAAVNGEKTASEAAAAIEASWPD